jgi:hypothetical protein
MTQVTIAGMGSMGTLLRIGALAAVFAFVAGPAQGQPPTTPPETITLDPLAPDGGNGKVSGEEPRRLPAKDFKPSPKPPAGNVAPTAEVKVVSKPPAVSTRGWLLEEVTTGFLIIMLSLGGIAAMAIFTRYYFRITTPTDPVQLALTDPWVRAHLGTAAPAEPTATPAEPDAPVPGES